MKWYLEGTLEKNLGVSTALLERYGIDRPEVFTEDLEWFTRKVRQNVFKRVQAPPIIITSKSAYGYDIRESILPLEPSGEHELLKESVLALERYQPATERT